MAVDRNLWKVESFTLQAMPLWPCPRCPEGRLVADKKTLYELEARASVEAGVESGWEPDWMYGAFSLTLRCNNPQCCENVLCAGSYGVSQEFDPVLAQGGQDPYAYCSRYTAKTFVPPIPVFRIPVQCPEAVRAEIQSAFAILWSDRGASANRVRIAIEKLLDTKKVKRTVTKRGKRTQLTLHSRIDKLASKTDDKDTHSLLMAVKWLGNAGSHGADMAVDDVLDGFELLDHILFRMFDGNTKRLLRLSKSIVKKKGPVSKK